LIDFSLPRDRIVGAGLAEVSELKAIEMEVRKSVDNDVKKVGTSNFLVVREMFGPPPAS
jgi:hypothetical protein